MTGFAMKDKRGVWKEIMSLTAGFHIRDLEYNLNLQALHFKRSSECFHHYHLCFCFCNNNLLAASGSRERKKKKKRVWGVEYLKWDAADKTARPPSTQITFPPHNLVLKSPSSSMILYTYTKLRTPVFSVKRCYAHLYCMYVYPSLLLLNCAPLSTPKSNVLIINILKQMFAIIIPPLLFGHFEK